MVDSQMGIWLVCFLRFGLTNLVKTFSYLYTHTHIQAVHTYRCDIIGNDARVRSLTLSGELLLMLCDRSLQMGRLAVVLWCWRCWCAQWPGKSQKNHMEILTSELAVYDACACAVSSMSGAIALHANTPNGTECRARRNHARLAYVVQRPNAGPFQRLHVQRLAARPPMDDRLHGAAAPLAEVRRHVARTHFLN